jgi:CP family cyanate transporter-like MFS transporter
MNSREGTRSAETPSAEPKESETVFGSSSVPSIPGTAGSNSGLTYGATVACIALVALALRPGIVSVGPLLPAIRQQFNLSHSEASLLTSIPDLLMGLLALPTPWLARRYGRDGVILAALVLLTLSMTARAFVTSAGFLLIATAGVGVGIAISGALFGGFVKGKFPEKAAALMGVYATALGVGSLLSAGASIPLSRWAGGWRFGIGVWGLLGVLAIGTWLYVERQERRFRTTKPAVQRAKLPFAIRKAWLIALYFGCQNLLFYACVSWIPSIFREHGFSETQSGLILAAYMASFLITTPLAGALSRSLDRRRWLALWAMITLVGIVLMASIPEKLPYLSAALTSLGIGGAFTLGMTLPLDNAREPGEANAWTAFTLTVGYLIAATGPYLVGILRDLTGGFRIPMAVLAAVGVVMVAVTPFLGPHRHDD